MFHYQINSAVSCQAPLNGKISAVVAASQRKLCI